MAGETFATFPSLLLTAVAVLSLIPALKASSGTGLIPVPVTGGIATAQTAALLIPVPDSSLLLMASAVLP